MVNQRTRRGRPSNVELVRREADAREMAISWLTQALQHLNHPSRLSDSPLCQLEGVRRQAALSPIYCYPRAHIVIQAVHEAYDVAWSELGESDDAGCLVALHDALQGMSREASARKVGVSPTEISRRRREAVHIIIDHVLARLQRP